jgi:hypothetical protein
MKHSKLALTAAFLAVSGGTALAVGLKDGSFEKPHVATGTQQIYAPGSSFGKWKIAAGGNVGVIGPDYTVDGLSLIPKRGAQMVNLCASGNANTGAVYQYVKLTEGAHYKLWFDVGTIVDHTHGYGPNSAITVSVDNQEVTHDVIGTGDEGTMRWNRTAISFWGGPNDSEIMFRGADGDAFCGLDGVSLVLDPP